MGKKFKNLYSTIYDLDNIWDAYNKTSRGKKDILEYLLFRENEANNIYQIHRELKNREYSPGENKLFTVYDPKLRYITALPFRDRVVQHAINNVIYPIFENVFLPQSFACRPGKGTHKGVIRLQSRMRKLFNNAWYLKTDFSKYFYNIITDILFKEICRKISCKETLTLIEKFHPKNKIGIPVGYLTSQCFANLYGHICDRFLLHQEKFSNFVRYMDDIVFLSESKNYLFELKDKIKDFTNKEMGLEFSKWYIKQINQGINFLGYRIWKDFKLVRKDSVIKAKKKVRHYISCQEYDNLNNFLSSWLGHVKWANSHNLIKSMEEKYALHTS